MTPSVKSLLSNLIDGHHYLKDWSTVQKSRSYKLYKGNMIPCRYVGNQTVRQIRDLLKKDKYGRYTLNLNRVRQLHGNSIIKRMYKQYLITRKSNSHGSNTRLCKDV